MSSQVDSAENVQSRPIIGSSWRRTKPLVESTLCKKYNSNAMNSYCVMHAAITEKISHRNSGFWIQNLFEEDLGPRWPTV